MVGQKLSHYRIVEKVGEGGMGTVYRAHDERLDRDVALKLLAVKMLADEATRKRFRKEALALSKLNHPSVATVFDFDTQDGMDFLVMEYVSGVTLKQKLAAGALPEKEVLALGAQLAEALEEAHGQGIVHRDLKPGNIMVTPKGRAKALDFGLAKLLRPIGETTTTESFTETQAVAGTLPYMPPEQLRGESADPRSDIYAAGAVLYEMATGQRAFREELAPRLTDVILHQPPLPPRAVNARVSPEVERIILKCLEKDPENRYQSAKELLVDLRRLMTPSTAAPVDTFRPGRRHRRYALVGAGLAVVLLLGVVVGLNVGGLRNRLLGGNRIPHIDSLAVLPLENLSGDKEQEYFADGMTDALISDLGKISAVRVISRTSVMRYKGTKKSAQEIAGELNVDAILEGTVVRAGEHVRVSANLIHASPERHLWSESYERDLRDVLALQDDVALSIAREIKVKLTPQEQARFTSARPVNPEAHNAYLKGRYYLNQWTEEGFKKGIEHFQQAIDLDPTYAPAYAGLADCYSFVAGWGLRPPKEAFPLAKAGARKALELDETLAEAHAALGLVKLQFDWDWPGAEQELKRAIELNPSGSDAHLNYNVYLAAMGRSDESITEARRALELDPLTPTLSLQLGWTLYYARRHDESIAQLRRTLELAPNLTYANMELGWNYAEKRMYPEAVAECRKAIERQPEEQVTLGTCGRVYGQAGKRSEALDILAKLKRMSEQRYVDPYNIAAVCDGLKDNNLTMEWLERAYKEHSASLYFLKNEIFAGSLRSDPRFQDLLRRVGLPP